MEVESSRVSKSGYRPQQVMASGIISPRCTAQPSSRIRPGNCTVQCAPAKLSFHPRSSAICRKNDKMTWGQFCLSPPFLDIGFKQPTGATPCAIVPPFPPNERTHASSSSFMPADCIEICGHARRAGQQAHANFPFAQHLKTYYS